MTAPTADHAHLPVMPPVIFAGCVLLSVGATLVAPQPLEPVVPYRIVGVLLGLVAAILTGWASATLRLHQTALRPNQPTTFLVTEGPYRFSRNPLYLALCLLHAGGALIVGQLYPLLITAILAMALYRLAMLPEEEYLEKKFGNAYNDYRRRVGRWF